MPPQPIPADTLGLYLSIPFCKAKCSFCNFASQAFPPQRMAAYVHALCTEIEAAHTVATAHGLHIPPVTDSIFLGGGTPSLLEPHNMRHLFTTLRTHFTLSPNAEITVEAAPGQLADDLLKALLDSGVNRISLGVQSFIDVESHAVGRTHTGEQGLAELERLRLAGIQDLNIDLIAGLPHQTTASWTKSLNAAIDSGVDHVSVYMLEVDEDSRLGRELIGPNVRYGATATPGESLVVELYQQACETLAAEGLAQYEISNFARPGHHSRHNCKYWTRAPYLGFGLDAHSMLTQQGTGAAVRFANTANLDTYIAACNSCPADHAEDADRRTPLANVGAIGDQTAARTEESDKAKRSAMESHEPPREYGIVDTLAAWEESIFLGLRLTKGVSLTKLRSTYPTSWVDSLQSRATKLAADGLMARSGDFLTLTPHGRILSSSIFAELLNPTA